MDSRIKQVRNPFIDRIRMIKLDVDELKSVRFHATLLLSIMLAGILTPVFSTYIGEGGHVVNINLYASALGGWGFTPDTIASPGPTITVNQDDIVNITLTSADGIKYNFFVDYNEDKDPTPGEPKSLDFTTTINHIFTANRLGTFTYYCQYHKSTMYGTFKIALIIRSTGRISVNVAANSGSAEDIQAAVDIATISEGNVYIPEGTFNFYEPGETWAEVVIPASVNLYGAATERDADGQVTEWKTVLVMPYDVYDPTKTGLEDGVWFRVEGSGDPNENFRFSDIKLVGYRDIDPNSTTNHRALYVDNVIDFRIDHCFFKHTTLGIWISGTRGVIDHCKFINEYGWGTPYEELTVGYGVGMGLVGNAHWEDDIDKVIGHYTDYTIFIEDCYFSRWRHCACSGYGMHYVFRHNMIENDTGWGSLDGHGTRVNIGTRAMEIYENVIIDPIKNPDNQPSNGETGFVVMWRGGGGVAFNNYIRNYHVFLDFQNEGDVEKCYPHDIWIWNNTLENVEVPFEGPAVQGEDYFLYEKANYEPYAYPHPLTLQED